MAKGNNRVKLGISRNLIAKISARFPEVTATQALEFFILSHLDRNPDKSAPVHQGINNEQRQTTKYKG
ncbi:hypothetical protein RI845_13495 [Thalassotalea nanhaiensis]|uniref:CopG family transcriptional regulator n=1 Tax=Thalassotalea nanhaiensis TaxID=3065648 RepID=A0ABY9TFL2_9GAMM|nr:hypothetical protein RI845_13495 [Colwelliaceae bacterium SQ345]